MAESEVNSPVVVIQQSVDADMKTPVADADVEVTGSNTVENGDALPSTAQLKEDVKEPIHTTYLDYLTSPIVQFNIMDSGNTTVLAPTRLS